MATEVVSDSAMFITSGSYKVTEVGKEMVSPF